MKIGIIGLGLIGGSLGRTILKKTQHEVFGLDLNQDVVATAEMISAISGELTEGNVGEMDMLIIALYPRQVEEYLEKYCHLLKSSAIVLDICGNKRSVVEIMKSYSKKFPSLQFVGTHPMAGREFIGIKHSTTTLFDRASMILVNVNGDISTLAFLKEFSLSLGFSKVVITSAENHDKNISFTSQLAHLVSSSYVKSSTAQGFFGFSAGSFRDMTRVARLSPSMWSQLMIDNRDNLVSELEEFIAHLGEYKTALENSDEKEMFRLLDVGNQIKLSLDKQKEVKE